MAQAAAIMQIIGAAASFTSGMMNAFGEKYTAESNANAYRAQAQNIGVQQGITARQYGSYENVLQGQAVTTAARQGVKVSGTVASSISRSLTALNLDKGYKLYNLEVEKTKAINNAKYQDWVADTALVRGFFSSTASALGSAGSSNLFSGGKQTTTNVNGVKMSGGTDFSNATMVSGATRIV